MPSEESPWHADLEAALAASELGFPDEYELGWSPLPPFDDWMIHVWAHGHDAAVVVTANQMTLTVQLVELLESNAAGRLIKVLAHPATKLVPPEVVSAASQGGVHLLPYGDN